MDHSSARRSTRRSPREWAVRGGLAAVAALLGYASTTRTLAYVVAQTNPERAYALAPGDGRVAAKFAELLATRQGDVAQRRRSTQLAHQALGDEPLAAPALTALALNTQIEGDTAGARRLFVHSDALSRRELGTRLWLIEDAVGRGDVPGALRHYDIALRTNANAADLLFPVLAGAIADPAIATALTNTLATKPAWSDALVTYLATSKTHSREVASFFERLVRHDVAVSPFAQAALVNALIAQGAFDAGWSYYASFRPAVQRNASRDPAFTKQPDAATVLDWTPVMNDAGITTSLQRTGQGGLADFAAPATVGGVVLQQVQMLPAGRYRLEGTSAGIEQDRTARPYWQLACLSGREIGRVMLPNSNENGGRFVGEFSFDGGCPAQSLRLVAQPSSAVGGTTGQITRAQLRPVGTAR